MKKLINLLVLACITTTAFAQSPEFTSYQAVIRDASNSLVASQNVSLRISILKDAADGTVVYQETQSATTNTNGLISIKIGAGTLIPDSGSFAEIDWANGSYFIKTETDPSGNSNYTISGTSQFLSVPYAMYAKTSGSASTSWTTSAANLFNANSGNVGIGTNDPRYKLDVKDGFFHTSFNTSSLPASDSDGGLAIGWNKSAGNAEVNFYNAFNSAGTSFLFSQKTGAATANDLLIIRGNGNVGIGTTNPTTKLHVKNGTLTIDDGTKPYTFPTADGSSGQVLKTDGAGNTSWGIETAGNNVFTDGAQDPTEQGAYLMWNKDGGLGRTHLINHKGGGQGGFKFEEASNDGSSRTTNMLLTGDGKLGIGTEGPTEKLDVSGKIAVYGVPIITAGGINPSINTRILQNISTDPTHQDGMYINYNSTGTTNNKVRFFTEGTTERMTINNDGNVGIGAISPIAKLHVNVNGAPTTTGVITTGIVAANGTGGRSLNMGVTDDNGGAAWLQSAFVNNAGVVQTLALNPVGGTVRINDKYNLPTTDGANGQVLKTNGSGTVSWAAATSGSDWSTSGNNIYNPNSGNVGIGKSNPDAKLHIDGSFKQTAGYDFYIDSPGIEGGKFKVTSTGNVGIGNNSPSEKLHVTGNSSEEETKIVVNSSTNGISSAIEIGEGSTGDRFAYLDLSGDDTNDDYGLRVIRFPGAGGNSSIDHKGTGALTLNAESDAPITFNTNGSEKMRVNGNGNVGIGTNEPGSILQVKGSFRQDSGSFSVGGANDFEIDADGVVGGRFKVTSAGNVGIGTNNPTSELHVKGSSENHIALFENTGPVTGDGIAIRLNGEHALKTVDKILLPASELITQITTGVTNVVTAGGSLDSNPESMLNALGLNDLYSESMTTYANGLIGEMNKILDGNPTQLDANSAVNFPFTTGSVVSMPGYNLDPGSIASTINIGIVGIDPPNLGVSGLSFAAIDLPNFAWDPAPASAGIDLGSFSIPATTGVAILPDLSIDPNNFNLKLPMFPTGSTTGTYLPITLNFPVIQDFSGAETLTKEAEFMTFLDKGNRRCGAITGESIEDWTLDQLTASRIFEIADALASLDPLDLGIGTIGEIVGYIESFNDIGVRYVSGNGDYAEWLERDVYTEDLSYGDIVAIKSGKITRNLEGAEQVMVISKAPIVMGNAPDEKDTHKGNMVAFIGQVPVKVMGPVVSGDYIVADEKRPGFGYAVSADKMTQNLFFNCVGRSWDTNKKQGFKFVNTLVGMHNKAWTKPVKALQNKVDDLEVRLKKIERFMMKEEINSIN